MKRLTNLVFPSDRVTAITAVNDVYHTYRRTFGHISILKNYYTNITRIPSDYV